MPGFSFVFGFKLLARDQPPCFGVEGTGCCICVFSAGTQLSEEPDQGKVEGRITLEAVGMEHASALGLGYGGARA